MPVLDGVLKHGANYPFLADGLMDGRRKGRTNERTDGRMYG